jgi:hypothetical protein
MEDQRPWEGQIIPANRRSDEEPGPTAKEPESTEASPRATRPTDSTQPARTGSPRGATLWAWWACTTAIGWALAGLGMGIFAPESGSVAQYAFIPISAIGQWLILRRHFAQASLWIVATVAGTAIAAFASVVLLALPGTVFGAGKSGVRVGISSLIDGLAIGGAQWYVLRNNVRGAERWILAAAAPLWLAALIQLGFGFDTVPEMAQTTLLARAVDSAVSVGIIGLMVGTLTGGVLAWMVDQPRAWEESD